MSKKTNITLKLDAELLRRIKVLAAQKGTSVSAMLTTKLEEVVLKDQEYEEAKKRAMRLMKESTASGWQKPKSREELHER
jgi:predicted transcriptional regulator